MGGKWLLISIGFLCGVLTYFFIKEILKSVKNGSPVRKQLGLLLLYSVSVALLALGEIKAEVGGVFNEWQYLGQPTIFINGIETFDTPVRILDFGYVETRSGNIFFRNLDCSSCEWALVDSVPLENERVEASWCRTFDFLPILPEDVIDVKEACVDWEYGSPNWELGLTKMVMVINESGQVQFWQNSDYIPPFMGEFIIFVVDPIIFGLISFIVGSVFIFFLKFRKSGGKKFINNQD